MPFVAKAQESGLRYGYISYQEAVKALPEYAQSQQNMATLKAKYDAEMQRVEDEFNKKYEDFLAGQRDFAPSNSSQTPSRATRTNAKERCIQRRGTTLIATSRARF